jgi:hypothetical protein
VIETCQLNLCKLGYLSSAEIPVHDVLRITHQSGLILLCSRYRRSNIPAKREVQPIRRGCEMQTQDPGAHLGAATGQNTSASSGLVLANLKKDRSTAVTIASAISHSADGQRRRVWRGWRPGGWTYGYNACLAICSSRFQHSHSSQ